MISLGYRGYKHCFGEANYHMQFTPKYRREIFRDEDIKMACGEAMKGIAARLGVVLHALEFGPDHCHLFIGNCRRYSASELAQRFKGASSYELRTKCAKQLRQMRLDNSLWSNGYFYESIGHVTSDRIRHYIERQQGKHWTSEAHKARTTREKQSSLQDYN